MHTTDSDFDGSESIDSRDSGETSDSPRRHLRATYSPEDNKLRLYSLSKLDDEIYERVKAAGFRWAPKQDLWVAPMWTPERAELLEELCGDIDDEDTSLADRAEERAERFEDYGDRREADAEAAHKTVKAIADNIPLGQPILVGHHSEKHARKHAEKIENGMRKAVKMWDTAQYWMRRAKGAIAHAKYKERPDVRQRRIKKLEAELRKVNKERLRHSNFMGAWSKLNLTREQAIAIANCDNVGVPDSVKEKSKYCSGLWSALTDNLIEVEPAIAHALKIHLERSNRAKKWSEHCENRLAYERAMLAEGGGTVVEKSGPEVGGAIRCWASPRGGWSFIKKVNKVSVTVEDNWNNGGDNFTRTIEFDKITATMTAAQVEEKRAAGLLVEARNKIGFFLTDAPVKARTSERVEPKPEIEAMRESLKQGVQVVNAPQLFPTPPELAARMVELAEIKPHHKVLEPSAGTGNIVSELIKVSQNVTAIEINGSLARQLGTRFPFVVIACCDFLGLTVVSYDRVVMNPPFENSSDTKHILHAWSMLADGGVLVAIASAGVKFRADATELRSLIAECGKMEDLPDDTFKSQGTSVRTVLITLRK